MAPGASESVAAQELLQNDGTNRAPVEHEAPEAIDEARRKSARIYPDAPANEPSTTQVRISAVHHTIAGVIALHRLLELTRLLARMVRRLMSK